MAWKLAPFGSLFLHASLLNDLYFVQHHVQVGFIRTRCQCIHKVHVGLMFSLQRAIIAVKLYITPTELQVLDYYCFGLLLFDHPTSFTSLGAPVLAGRTLYVLSL